MYSKESRGDPHGPPSDSATEQNHRHFREQSEHYPGQFSQNDSGPLVPGVLLGGHDVGAPSHGNGKFDKRMRHVMQQVKILKDQIKKGFRRDPYLW